MFIRIFVNNIDIIFAMRRMRFLFNSFFRCSGLCVIVTVYLGLFAIAAIILFGSLLKLRGDIPENCDFLPNKVTNSFCGYHKSDGFRQKSVIANITRSIDYEYDFDSFSRLLEFHWGHSHSNPINCSTIKEITDIEFLAAGWTKVVYKGTFRGANIAIKTVKHDGYDIQNCQKKHGISLNRCILKINSKLVKEIILLTELAHTNLVKLLGFCISDDYGSVTYVTELGEPLDTVHLLQISWEDRLHLILGIAHILHHFANSPLGSVSMNDFRREQFIIVDGVLKVTDLDDVGIGDPECLNDTMCQNILNFGAKDDASVNTMNTRNSPCLNFHCIGHNSKINIWHAGQHFVKLLLPIGAPASLKPYVQMLLDAYEFKETSESKGDVADILRFTNLIVNHYRTGRYIQTFGDLKEQGFGRIEDVDLPGIFDYRCRYSISAVSCVMSVYNEEEAAVFCSKDINCKVVVLSQQKTWTGRIIAIFKNGFDSPVMSKGLTLIFKENLQ